MEMRYLFKAKRLDNGEWVQGCYIYDIDRDSSESLNEFAHRIQPLYAHAYAEPVNPSTICQCTGLKDKNGNLIWENDIVKFEDYGEEQGPEYKEGYEYENNARVEFAEGRWSLTDFADDNSAVMDNMDNHAEFTELWSNSEVIGNVFDNPEMLEE